MTSEAIPDGRERYVIGYSDEVHQGMAQRTAASHASFFLPHLRPGMQLLDVGSGPGTMTLDLAEASPPAST